MITSSLHNHTNYCDGSNTPEEMAAAAYAAGCTVFGFSEHSVMPAGERWYDRYAGMLPEAEDAYIRDVLALRERYAGKMEIVLGLEQDLFSPAARSDYDYVIGSIHYIRHGDRYCCIDDDPAGVKERIRAVYEGDSLAYAEDYYAWEATVAERTGCDIIGHFDLLTKFNEKEPLIDTGAARYRDAAMAAMEQLLKRDVIFEINSGAIARGYRTAPYPEMWLLKELRARDARIMLSSDAHSAAHILFGLKESAELARMCGFTEKTVWKNGALRREKL